MLQSYAELGKQWKRIAGQLPGRSASAVKNLFYSIVRKNLRKYNRDRPVEEQLNKEIQTLLRDTRLCEILLTVDTPGIYAKVDCSAPPQWTSPRASMRNQRFRFAETAWSQEEVQSDESFVDQYELLLDTEMPDVHDTAAEIDRKLFGYV